VDTAQDSDREDDNEEEDEDEVAVDLHGGRHSHSHPSSSRGRLNGVSGVSPSPAVQAFAEGPSSQSSNSSKRMSWSESIRSKISPQNGAVSSTGSGRDAVNKGTSMSESGSDRGSLSRPSDGVAGSGGIARQLRHLERQSQHSQQTIIEIHRSLQEAKHNLVRSNKRLDMASVRRPHDLIVYYVCVIIIVICR
jgi:hypothetical protein